MRIPIYSLLMLWSLMVNTPVNTGEPPSGARVAAWGFNYDGEAIVPEAALSGVTAIAAGLSHSVALKSDGSVVAWGNNYYGQVSGTPDVVQPYSEVAHPVALVAPVTAIAAGRVHTVYLVNDGSVTVYGEDAFGLATVPTAAETGVVAIAAGTWHTVALKIDGSVVAWGGNGFGQVTGTPTEYDVPVIATPVTLEGKVLREVKAIAAAHLNTVALKTDGSVVAWGNNDYGQTNVPVAALSGVIAVATGGDFGDPRHGVPGTGHIAVLKNDGSVSAWGNNAYGQTDVPATAMSGVVAIAAGATFTIALKIDGSVVAWGDNRGDLIKVPAGLIGVTAIAAGGFHTMVMVDPSAPVFTTAPKSRSAHPWQSSIFTAGAIGFPLNYQWRKDGVDIAGATNATYDVSHTQPEHQGSYSVIVSNFLGTVTSTPPAVLTVEGAAAPGTVVAWGSDQFGQTTLPVAALSGVSAISAGPNHTIALINDGSVVAWPSHHAGNIKVPLAAKSGVIAIAAGGYGNSWEWEQGHSIALKCDGTVVAWGNNGSGQVTGTPTDASPQTAIAYPVILQGNILDGVSSVAAGAVHTVALKMNGSVVAWGANNYGQAKIPLAAQSGVKAIAAGAWHTVALKNDGSVLAWGFNKDGQTKVPLTALSGVTAIAAGPAYTVALKADGTVVSWGMKSIVEATQGITEVVAVAAGEAHIVALRPDGSVLARGFNDFGQVTGTPTIPGIPVTADPVTLSGHVLSGITAIAAGGGHTVALIGTVPLLSHLSIRSNGNELIVSWPTILSGYALQASPSLSEPEWKDVSEQSTVLNYRHQVVLSAPSARAFYRLRRP